MQVRKRIAALLTSTSMMALSVAAVPAFAGTVGGSRQDYLITSPQTYVYLDSTFDASGDVVLLDDVGSGVSGLDANPQEIGMLVNADASIAGKLAVVHAASLSATASGSGNQVATALRIEGHVGRVLNNGTIEAHANAFGSEVSATAYGVNHSVSGTGGAGTIENLTLKNNGTILATATASATTSSDQAKASASAYGVYQYAYDETVNARLTNNGSITADARAVASGSSQATAEGTAYGVYQYAYGNGSADSAATADLTNNGDISAKAFASASASDSESVYAEANANAVYQYAYYAQTALSNLDNAGHISATATAKADGNAYDDDTGATANASGVDQYAYGNSDPGSKATNSLTNSGTIEAHAIASATDGSSGRAIASADAYGVYQYAADAETSLDKVNNSGDILVTAHAVANGVASATDATAGAEAYGVYQYALGNSAVGSTATASVTNSGDIDVTAFASADSQGTGEANASATAYGVYQYAYDAPTTLSKLDNSGDITVHATGIAIGGTAAEDASASASADGVVQYAYADATLGSSATVSLTNSGHIDVTAFASAKAYGSEYDASASATAYGVYQGASHAQTSVVTLHNSGDITVHATGKAIGGTQAYEASASASAYGVYQYAYGNNLAGSSATIALTNSGTIDVHAVATASNSGTGHASASATAYGVYQYAKEAQTSLVTLDNSGDIIVHATGKAINQTKNGSSASASATADGVAQYAYGTTEFGASATASLTNSGNIDVTAFASAKTEGTSAATASAVAGGVFQEASTAETALAKMTNSGDINVSATANAVGGVSASDATASAVATGVHQEAYATSSSTSSATASLTNSGSIDVQAFASAKSSGTGSAQAQATVQGVYQYVVQAQTALATVTNTGDILVQASASAYGGSGVEDATASASAIGVSQRVVGNLGAGSTATASLANDGSILVGATAYASNTGTAKASANATAIGVHQDVSAADTVLATMTNNGDITVGASAVASGAGSATSASAYATAVGVKQVASGDGVYDSATATLTNTGNIEVTAYAAASMQASGTANATASAIGVYQEAKNSGTNSVTFTNDGNVYASATAYATGGADAADVSATANAYAVSQVASGVGGGSSATATLTNNGTIDADAEAYASSLGGVAFASASATGVYQEVENASTQTASVTNTGDIYAYATAEASGGTSAKASAFAYGVAQFSPSGTLTANLDNSGDIYAQAFASATSAPAQVAFASAIGYKASAVGGDLVLDATNSGSISASASAVGTNAKASAVGVELTAQGLLTGSLTNSGEIYAWAYAEGTSTGNAAATGVRAAGNNNGVTISNSGLIGAYAESSGFNSVATARAIVITDDGTPVGGSTATIENHGGFIYAAYSDNGGSTFHRGTAIDTLDAPNPVIIDLQGNNPDSYADGYMAKADGAIYGDINISADDTINVTNGKTGFDGVINADETLRGTLDIYDGGWFGLANRDDGPSLVYVDTFTNESDGTIAFELTSNTTPGNYPVITANTANLSGTLEARFLPELYGNTPLFYDNVIDANVRNGTFNDVVSTPLMDVVASYDGSSNVDLTATRVAFDDVSGLTRNQRSVGGGIENVYADIDPMSNFGNLVANLFTLDDQQYQYQLDALGGAEYPQYLQSVLTSTSDLEHSLADRMGGVASGGSGADPIVNAAPVPVGSGQVWGYVRGGKDTLNGDDEAPGYDGDRQSVAVGADWSMSNRFFIGAAAAYFKEDLSFDNSDNTIDYDGGQVAIYGGYDDMQQYARGMIAYGFYNGDSTRYVTPVLNGPRDKLTGSPDSDVFSVSGEIGKRFDIGGGMVATPFLGGRYASANMDGFTESDEDGSGAALNVSSSDAHSLTSTVGARLTADWAMGKGVFRPQVSAAWVHEFDDTYQTVGMSFDAAPAGSGFNIIGSDVSRDSLLVSVGGSYEWSKSVQISVNYDGLFNSDYTSQSVTGRLGYKF